MEDVGGDSGSGGETTGEAEGDDDNVVTTIDEVCTYMWYNSLVSLFVSHSTCSEHMGLLLNPHCFSLPCGAGE